MKNNIIITGHGSYATGLTSALEMIIGPKEGVKAIEFTTEDTNETLEKKFLKVLKEDENYIFICDLLGGTPYKEAAKLIATKNNVKVVTGANLGGIMDTIMKKDRLDFNDLTDNVVKATEKNLQIIELKKEETNTVPDGI